MLRNIERRFNDFKEKTVSAKGNVARTVGIGLMIALPGFMAVGQGSASADQGGPVTSSEEPLIPEPGKEYQVIIDEGVWLANDEIRRLMDLGLYDIGGCIKITEILDPNSVLTGGPITYRHLFSRCEVPVIPAITPETMANVIAQYKQCGKTPGLEAYNPNVNVLVQKILKPDGTFGYVNTPLGVDGDCPVEKAPTPAPAMAAAVGSVAKGSEVCADGELILVHAADQGGVLSRIPIGEAERVDIVEVSWRGKGFGDLDRIILVTPPKGSVWEVNVKPGANTIAARGFCGSKAEVEAWAVKAHVASLQQASRDKNGNQPQDGEIGVYSLDFEKGALNVVQGAGKGPDPKELLDKIDVSFHEGNIASNVPLHVQ